MSCHIKEILSSDAMVEARVQIRCVGCNTLFNTPAEHGEHTQGCVANLESIARRRCPTCSQIFATHASMKRHTRRVRCGGGEQVQTEAEPHNPRFGPEAQVMWKGRLVSALDVPLGMEATRDLMAALTQLNGGALRISLTPSDGSQ